MIDLKNVSLLDLQTAYMKQDPTTQGLCAALQPIFTQLANEVKACLIFSMVDELEDDILDELAWQMHVDWYDANAETEAKRKIIKTAFKIHRLRGTPYAVEEVVKAYFSEAEIKEWFEYGGDPYMFRVIVDSSAMTPELESRFTLAVNAAKNLRSHMELVINYNKYQELEAFTHAELSAYTHTQLRESDLSG